MKKICTGICKKRKPLKDFSKDKARKDGRRSACRDCTSKQRASRAKGHKVIIPPERISRKCMDRWWV